MHKIVGQIFNIEHPWTRPVFSILVLETQSSGHFVSLIKHT